MYNLKNDLANLDWENIGSLPFFIKILIIVTGSIMALAAGYFFDLNNQFQIYNALILEKKDIQKQYETIQHEIINIEAYKKQLIEVKNALASVTEQLPMKNKEANLLEDISQEAVAQGLKFLSFSPMPEQNKGFYVEQPLEITLLGHYHAFGEFVAQISKIPRIVTFHDFSMQIIPSKEKHDKKITLEINIVCKAYWSTTLLMKDYEID